MLSSIRSNVVPDVYNPESSKLSPQSILCIYGSLSLFTIGLAIWEIYCGGYYWDNSCNNPLQVWLIVNGSFSIFQSLSNFIKQLFTDESPIYALIAWINNIGAAFGIAWLIVGSVWLWQSNDTTLCDKTVWVTVEVILCACYAALGLALSIGCCVGCCATFCIVH